MSLDEDEKKVQCNEEKGSGTMERTEGQTGEAVAGRNMIMFVVGG